MAINDHKKSVTTDSIMNTHYAQAAAKILLITPILMITVNLSKDLIANAFKHEEKTLSHYSREAILATCARAA